MKKRTGNPSPVIADRIAQVISDNNVSCKAVSDRIGMDRRAVLYARNGMYNPSIVLIRYLCKTYHVDANWLLDL